MARDYIVGTEIGSLVSLGNTDFVPEIVEIYAPSNLVEVAGITGAIGSGGSTQLAEPTVDSGDMYRIILFADGTVRGIPIGTPNPIAPTGLAAQVRLSSVKLSWVASPTPNARYIVIRDGVIQATVGSTFYRDINIAASSIYSYTVLTVDPYNQRSAQTSAVTAFIDPTTNHAPSITVTAWPPTFPTNGKTYLRVNGRDVDAQQLAMALTVDVGSVAPTDDPSLWIYTPGA